MVKRTLRWGTVLILVLLAYLYGYVSLRLHIFPANAIERFLWWVRSSPIVAYESLPPGRWHAARDRSRAQERMEGERQAQVFGLPYAAGTRPATRSHGVTLHDPQRAEPGLNLVLSAHNAEAVLLDMEGRRVRAWTGDPSYFPDEETRRRAAPYWRRVRMLDDGGILAIREGSALVRLDAESKLLWVHMCECHHDLDLDAAGNILVLDRRSLLLPHVNSGREVLVDYVVTVSPEGKVLSEFSVLEAFERSEFVPLLDGMIKEGDLFHTNTLSRLTGRPPSSGKPALAMFAEGHLLISLRHLDIIAVIDPEARRVVWAMKGLWRRQHDPVLLDTGNMLVFDNEAGPQRSRVLELDPATLRIVWSYQGSDEAPFYSETCGTSQRLPGGNTLITESDQGRAFEVTPDDRIVWEYVNPWRAGASGELVATLFEVTRIPADPPAEAQTAGAKKTEAAEAAGADPNLQTANPGH